ncbi:hypothetical protein BQ8482_120098 [Mesorhizobium delmotii]|uniref:Uncharacterized protein n=1 Tax=Mesorhizobium delmotii TaxID=1631247 RepID=A0A2P9AFY3_9HYPH|nr:hypothetical protein BQ8482_120098 [Mesorhizobium delmotii]
MEFEFSSLLRAQLSWLSFPHLVLPRFDSARTAAAIIARGQEMSIDISRPCLPRGAARSDHPGRGLANFLLCDGNYARNLFMVLICASDPPPTRVFYLGAILRRLRTGTAAKVAQI